MTVVIYLLPASLLDMFSPSFDRNSEHSCHANLVFFLMGKSISKRLRIFFLNVRNRDFGEKLPSNSFSKWSSKYSRLLFLIFR
jgi:hypothetical protein